MKIKTLSALCVLTPAMAFSAADEFQYRSGKRIAVDDKSGEVNIRIDKTTSKPTLSISAGNENGISHNYFTEFNVGKRGLDIDNTRSAKVIINEVTGNNRSSLSGNISVLHNPASLIIANPNGITCDDCSATNINGITFVTGNVSVSPETGKITGYNTIRNRIMFKNIKPGAFKNSLFSVSRALDITGSVIDAKTLNITTGVKDLEFRNNIQTQINKQKTVRSKEESKSQKKYFLDINEDSSIKSALTINAKNTNVMNSGTIRNKNSTLNLLFSELINDKEINSNHLNMNIK